MPSITIGREGEGIQPHNIPLVPQGPGTQGIGAGKEHRGPIPPLENPVQKDGKNSPARPSFTGTSIEKAQSIPLRYQHRQQIQGEAR